MVRVTAISRPMPMAIVPAPALPAAGKARALPCAGDPDLFFAESPDDVELAKSLCSDCPVRPACLVAPHARNYVGCVGRERSSCGEIVPRKRGRGKPRKNDVAAWVVPRAVRSGWPRARRPAATPAVQATIGGWLGGRQRPGGWPFSHRAGLLGGSAATVQLAGSLARPRRRGLVVQWHDVGQVAGP
jgi:WhiB family redox-sensing transcriptional regulator